MTDYKDAASEIKEGQVEAHEKVEEEAGLTYEDDISSHRFVQNKNALMGWSTEEDCWQLLKLEIWKQTQNYIIDSETK